MAVLVDGFRFSYDYSELLGEIREDLMQGDFSESDFIYVVRGEERKVTPNFSFRPIVDYYTKEEFSAYSKPEPDAALRHVYDDEEWEEYVQQHKAFAEQLSVDKESIEQSTVLAVLTEMEEYNGIL